MGRSGLQFLLDLFVLLMVSCLFVHGLLSCARVITSTWSRPQCSVVSYANCVSSLSLPVVYIAPLFPCILIYDKVLRSTVLVHSDVLFLSLLSGHSAILFLGKEGHTLWLACHELLACVCVLHTYDRCFALCVKSVI